MDIELDREALVRELGLARRLGERKSTLPVYGYAKLAAADGVARIFATDGDAGLETGCPAMIAAPGTALVPVKTLHEIARAATSETVRLVAEGQRIAATAGAYRSKLQTFALDAFPDWVAWPATLVPLPARPLRDALAKTRFVVEGAMGRGQPNLQGVLCKVEGARLVFVATDGLRLAHVEAPYTSAVESTALLPRKAMDDLMALVDADDAPDTVLYATDGARAFVEVGARRYATRLVDGTFPAYQRVIPPAAGRTADLDRDLLLGALRRVMLVATESARRTLLTLADGALTATMASAEVGDAIETVPAAIAGAGNGWRAAFDAHYLAEFLAAADPGPVRFEQQPDAMRPGKFVATHAGSQYLYVLMPMSDA